MATDSRAGISRSLRIRLFALICLASAVAAIAYVVLSSTSKGSGVLSGPTATGVEIASLRGQPHLLFLATKGDAYRRVSLTSLEAGGDVLQSSLECQRVYFVETKGLCLGSDAYSGNAQIFDASLEVQREIGIGGIASRARISPDERYGAMTVFVQGHSYLEAGFSTRTAIVDMATGEFVVEDLEEISVFRDGESFTALDFNFWGVTFAQDGNRFYATLGTGGSTYLLEGDVAAREAHVLKENVECPSLSPDDSRLVFKKRIRDGLLSEAWQLYVLDLATMTERPIAETRSVDDQVEWLDDSHILYFLRDAGPPSTLRPDIWMASVDEDEAPQQLWTGASSPAVVR